MTDAPDTEPGRPSTVLLVESQPEVRARVSEALREAGMEVTEAARIGDVERWPEGGTVVTDMERFTAWWRHVGAEHIIVLAGTAREGEHACSSGATAWVPRNGAPEVLVRMIAALGRRH